MGNWGVQARRKADNGYAQVQTSEGIVAGLLARAGGGQRSDDDSHRRLVDGRVDLDGRIQHHPQRQVLLAGRGHQEGLQPQHQRAAALRV